MLGRVVSVTPRCPTEILTSQEIDALLRTGFEDDVDPISGDPFLLTSVPIHGTVRSMIRTFRHRALERLFQDGDASKVRRIRSSALPMY
jgi:hypothetical protein